MKAPASFLLPFLVFSLAHAPAADQATIQPVILAVQKLAVQENYSWISTSQSAPGTRSWRQGPTKGKTEKNGCTFVTFNLGDNTISIGFKGTNAAINWSDTWHSSNELEGEYAWIGQRLKTYKPPAQEALFLAQRTPGLTPESDGALSGQLDMTALQWILSRGRQEFTNIPRMKGTVKFRFRNQELIQYEYTVQGTLPLNPDQPEIQINRTTTVTIQKVGATKVTVPPEAAQKLQ